VFCHLKSKPTKRSRYLAISLCFPSSTSAWTTTNNFPSAKIRLCCVCADITTTASIYGTSPEVGVYIGYGTPSIIKYLELKTGDLFTARYADSIFDEDHFLALGGGLYLKTNKCREIEWNGTSFHSIDPRTRDVELEVQRIIHLQQLANSLPYAFTDIIRGVSRSHIPSANAPERVETPMEVMNSTQAPNPRKRGREPDDLVDAPRRHPQKQNTRVQALRSQSVVPEVTRPEGEGPSAPVHTNMINSTRASEQPDSSNMGNQNELDDPNEEIVIDYTESRELYRNTTVIDINFISKIAIVINEDPEPKSMAECQKSSD
jgi:hypothetical protein